MRSSRFITVAAVILLTGILAVFDALYSSPSLAESRPIPCSLQGVPSPRSGNPFNPDQGQNSKALFLVADKQIGDPSFRETVIFLFTFDLHGAAGVIINRPGNEKLSAVFPEIKGLTQKNDPVYLGGPVNPEGLLFLVRTDSPDKGSRHLFDNVYITAGDSALKRMVDNPRPNEKFRVYAGYAGWGPGQLENEIARGNWHIVDADPKFIFDKDASFIWPELNSVKPSIEVRNGIRRDCLLPDSYRCHSM